MSTTTRETLAADYRVRAARELLERSKTAEPGEVDSARWWGRLEQALEGVLAAVDEAK